MNNEITQFFEKYPQEIAALCFAIRETIFALPQLKIEEKMWAKMPSYYCGDRFIRIIPFKNHINLEASGFALHKKEFEGYLFTPKGMLQLFPKQNVDTQLLQLVFLDTLREKE